MNSEHEHSIDHARVLADLRDKFYADDGTCTIFQGKGSGPVQQSPSTRLGRMLGVTKFVAAVVAPTAATAMIYAFAVSPNLEGPLTAQSWEAAHHATFDSQEAMAQVAGARGPHHHEGVGEALIEAHRLTPVEIAAEANKNGWSGNAVETIMKRGGIHKVDGQFVVDPSLKTAESVEPEAVHQLHELIHKGAAILGLPQAQFAGAIGPALDQFLVVSDSYLSSDPEARPSGVRLHEEIYVGSDKTTAVVGFNIETGYVGVREFSTIWDTALDRIVSRPMLDTHLVDAQGNIMEQYEDWYAEDMSQTLMSKYLRNSDIENRLAEVDQPGAENWSTAESAAPRP